MKKNDIPFFTNTHSAIQRLNDNGWPWKLFDHGWAIHETSSHCMEQNRQQRQCASGSSNTLHHWVRNRNCTTDQQRANPPGRVQRQMGNGKLPPTNECIYGRSANEQIIGWSSNSRRHEQCRCVPFSVCTRSNHTRKRARPIRTMQVKQGQHNCICRCRRCFIPWQQPFRTPITAGRERDNINIKQNLKLVCSKAQTMHNAFSTWPFFIKPIENKTALSCAF